MCVFCYHYRVICVSVCVFSRLLRICYFLLNLVGYYWVYSIISSLFVCCENWVAYGDNRFVIKMDSVGCCG